MSFPLTTKDSNGVSINRIHCVTRYDDDPLMHLLTQPVFIPTRGNNIIDVFGANISECVIRTEAGFSGHKAHSSYLMVSYSLR